VHAAAGAAARIADLTVPGARYSVNIGNIGGGEAINARARDAWFEADLRADTAAALRQLADRAAGIITTAAGTGLAVDVAELGRRPAGGVAPSSPLARAASDALARAGIDCEFSAASTDANAAYAAGIAAVALGVTRGAGEHTTGEWIETAPVAAGLAALADTIGHFREERG
jgi:acetylornithine deacetylase/succinyl-diaminopimelate desuccinylase-like protein